MTDEPNKQWDGSGAHGTYNANPHAEKQPYKTVRPKARRKGQLNDGQWAPGYGPDAKKKKP